MADQRKSTSEPGPGEEGNRKVVGREASNERVPDEGIPETSEGRNRVDDLIIKVLGGTASPFEEGRLKRWRRAGGENEARFQEAARIWNLTAPEPLMLESPPPSVEEILATSAGLPPDGEDFAEGNDLPPDHPDQEGGFHRGPPSASRRKSWLGWGLLAASVATMALSIRFFGPGRPDLLAVHRAEDGNRTVTLSDGSFVRIAQGSVVQEWDTGTRREVTLEGRAFFAVTPDLARPFVVNAGRGAVTVLGTRFQVETDGSLVETAVVEGRVSVSNHHGSIDVSAGQVARMTEGEGPTSREVEDILAYVRWPDGILIFQATPLGEVAQEVSRHYGKVLRLNPEAGTELENRRITAWFQGEPFETVTESLCLVARASCETSGDTVLVVSAGAGGTP